MSSHLSGSGEISLNPIPTKQNNNSKDSSLLVQEIMKKRSLNKHNHHHNKSHIDYLSYLLLGLVIFITISTYPYQNSDSSGTGGHQVTIQHVWYNGWITAVATGCGVLPFFFLSEPDKYWIGVSNAIAGGMMLAASFSLIHEAVHFEDSVSEFGFLGMFPGIDLQTHGLYRALCGVLLGIVFILGMKKVLDQYEDLNEFDMKGASAQKMILIIVVMTLHSLSEGIGIGVSFGGQSGMKLGHFISLSLAVHNIPEGLAVALVLTSRKVSNVRTILWAIFTSIPQPLFAVPAYLFVEKFLPLLPAGLGFAAGAMSYVAIFELLTEAVEDTSLTVTAIAGCLSFIAMTLIQEMVHHVV